MSYNISTFKIKVLDGFKFDVNAIKKQAENFWPGLDGDAIEISESNGTSSICFFGGPEIIGKLDGNWLELEKMYFDGEWSGTLWREVILPSLAGCPGKLEVVLIWEGGDYMERVFVNDGEYTEEEVDL